MPALGRCRAGCHPARTGWGQPGGSALLSTVPVPHSPVAQLSSPAPRWPPALLPGCASAVWQSWPGVKLFKRKFCPPAQVGVKRTDFKMSGDYLFPYFFKGEDGFHRVNHLPAGVCKYGAGMSLTCGNKGKMERRWRHPGCRRRWQSPAAPGLAGPRDAVLAGTAFAFSSGVCQAEPCSGMFLAVAG